MTIFLSKLYLSLHPLVALWFLDRHLRRTRPEWLATYRRCLILLPLLIVGMVWQLSGTTSLADDNGLAWRITQHAGGQLLPNVSTHLLVSMHVFLEMLHYGVWIIALPLIGESGAIWSTRTIPLARRRGGFWQSRRGRIDRSQLCRHQRQLRHECDRRSSPRTRNCRPHRLPG
jgi:hypothetical protein